MKQLNTPPVAPEMYQIRTPETEKMPAGFNRVDGSDSQFASGSDIQRINSQNPHREFDYNNEYGNDDNNGYNVNPITNAKENSEEIIRSETESDGEWGEDPNAHKNTGNPQQNLGPKFQEDENDQGSQGNKYGLDN